MEDESIIIDVDYEKGTEFCVSWSHIERYFDSSEYSVIHDYTEYAPTFQEFMEK